MSGSVTGRRLAAAAGLIGVVGASLSGCGGGGSGSPGGGGMRAVCQANPHTAGRSRWTVLVYIDAANNLQPDSLLNVGQMAGVGSDATNLNIVIQWKQANAPDSGSPTFIGTRRYYLHLHSASDVTQIEAGNTSVLDPDRLPDPATNNPATGQSDMGDYHTLADFVHWGTLTYPADNLALVVWDHGSGWQPVYRAPARRRIRPSFKAVCQDNETQDEIETWELPLALQSAAQPVDMLIFDCSLEQMAEVAFQVRNSARAMVGSEESPPAAGYPYDKWLAYVKSSGQSPCDVGSAIASDFVAEYPSYADITQSVLDLSKMQNAANALEAFAITLLQHVNDQASALASARNNAQQYAYPDNKDLFNYAALAATDTNLADVRQAAAGVQAALTGSSGAVVASAHGASSQSGSYGLAVYVPAASAFLTSYGQLGLAQAGAAPDWPKFLQAQTR